MHPAYILSPSPTPRSAWLGINERRHLCPQRISRIRMSTNAAAEAPKVLSSERASNLPWERTIAKDEFPLLFMPFIMKQLEKMNELSGMQDLEFEEELSYNESTKKSGRIESWLWKTDQFRKIRASYIDAGLGAQVFNSVWYPNPEYDLPLLGIDFLSFGRKRVLCILDFQPLCQDKEYLRKYCEPLIGIKEKYEGLSGSMTSRFYDEAQFFSRQLVFAKFDNFEPITTQLLPCFEEYMNKYVEIIMQAKPDHDEESKKRVLQMQKDYDQYSAERDPAVGLFTQYWGAKWAEKFTYEFLFSDAVPVAKESK